jgi:hypothetical protein
MQGIDQIMGVLLSFERVEVSGHVARLRVGERQLGHRRAGLDPPQVRDLRAPVLGPFGSAPATYERLTT